MDADTVKPLELTAEQIGQITKIANDRKLNLDDLLGAAKTYMPSGRHDDYVLFSSGGQSGQVFAIGVPSMRLLRSISVFTPESWQGYGFSGNQDHILKQLEINGKPVLWGDTHHPGLSETNAEYDGQFLFISDKANARIGVIDLRDWETKQICKNPLTVSDHGAGIPDFAREKIFEKFYSLERPDTGRKSTGLGLAFVKLVVELHGGSVFLTHRPGGKGTVARLEFPIKQTA